MNNASWDFFSRFPWIVKPQDQIIISATCQTPYSQKLLVAAYLSVAFCCVMLWEVCYVGLVCCTGLCYAMWSLLCYTTVLRCVVLCYVKFVMNTFLLRYVVLCYFKFVMLNLLCFVTFFAIFFVLLFCFAIWKSLTTIYSFTTSSLPESSGILSSVCELRCHHGTREQSGMFID